MPGELTHGTSGRFEAGRLRAWPPSSLGRPPRASLCRVLQAQVHSAERAFSKAAEKVRTVLAGAARGLCDPVQLGPDGRAAAQALEINLNPKWYGTLAEIGAGQEARHGLALRPVSC